MNAGLTKWRRSFLPVLLLALAMILTGCSGQEEKTAGADTTQVAGDYYIDLTDLGMKLTLYLRLDGEGTFTFSNTLEFETVKSSGTFRESDGAWLMVYDSVNGEAKTASDGLTSTFTVQEDKSLNFTGCDCICYGSARATTTSADNPDAKLIAYVVTDDYEAPDTSTDFQTGIYTAEDITEAGITYKHTVTFFEDNTYLHVTRWEQDGRPGIVCETGTWGVNVDQLALEPGGGDRLSSTVVDAQTLELSVLPYAGAQERVTAEFRKTEETEILAELSGSITVSGDDGKDEELDVAVTVYTDGSYASAAGDFTENGILVIDTENGTVKQYPDHPETGVRGLNQVTTVPAGTCTVQDGKLSFEGLRVRKSAGLTRYECSVTQ